MKDFFITMFALLILALGGLSAITAVAAGAQALGYLINYSEGERYGEVTKLSHKGLFFKTWEGELFTQSSRRMVSSGNAFGTYFKFSVKDPRVVEKLQNFGEKPVALVYSQPFILPFWVGDSEYLIVDVRPLITK